MRHDLFSWNRWKTADARKMKSSQMKINRMKWIKWKAVNCIIFENNNMIAFQWGVIHRNWTGGSDIRAIKRFETAKRKYRHQQENSCLPYRPPKARKFCKIARKCVKLIFRNWKCRTGLGPAPILSYQRKTSRERA